MLQQLGGCTHACSSEVEGGNAICCCALGKQGGPWGIATNITQGLQGSPVTSVLRTKEAWKMLQPAAEAACMGDAGSRSAFLEGDGAEEAGTLV